MVHCFLSHQQKKVWYSEYLTDGALGLLVGSVHLRACLEIQTAHTCLHIQNNGDFEMFHLLFQGHDIVVPIQNIGTMLYIHVNVQCKESWGQGTEGVPKLQYNIIILESPLSQDKRN